MTARILATLLALAVLAAAGVYVTGQGWLGRHWGPGHATPVRIPAAVISGRAQARQDAARRLGIEEPEQILFGDLHVHTTYSTDAFLMAMPMNGGDGAYPVADACDFARYCSALDFWSINDHAVSLTRRRWRETLESIRQCNAVSGDTGSPDVVALLGWEWTQVGTTPENHYGHRNVILKALDDDHIPVRPISADSPAARGMALPGAFALGMIPLLTGEPATLDLVTYLQELQSEPPCPEGVPERELPAGCHESTRTPGELLRKLDDWGFDSLVIPHGTTWGFYTPAGSSWDKQLGRGEIDPARQKLIEVYSGHGNSEEYRSWREVEIHPDGSLTCPEPTPGHLPSCWRAGELIHDRCRAAGEAEPVCRERAADARRNYLEAGISGHLTVPGATAADWQDAGQCRDCFLPAFNYRPRSSVQYIMALTSFDRPGPPLRFRFGFMASSDNHSARPGTGYKELARTEMTEARFEGFARGIFGRRSPPPEPEPISRPLDPRHRQAGFFGLRETERQASFFLTGGLIGVHARGRDREALWQALERKEVYGTSGPRILLWFDLVDAPGGRRLPMGSGTRMRRPPRFEVRAAGSFEQEPGCPEHAREALSPERLQRLCRGECYHPSDRRRLVSRIEVIRIRPQATPGEDVTGLIEDPWRVFPCSPDPAGCRIRFEDPDFPQAARDTLYYVRAIEAPGPAVNAGNLRCRYDRTGRCVSLEPCAGLPPADDCLAETEERAWSSPIFVDWAP